MPGMIDAKRDGRRGVPLTDAATIAPPDVCRSMRPRSRSSTSRPPVLASLAQSARCGSAPGLSRRRCTHSAAQQLVPWASRRSRRSRA
jgi:hypothetical protein